MRGRAELGVDASRALVDVDGMGFAASSADGCGSSDDAIWSSSAAPKPRAAAARRGRAELGVDASRALDDVDGLGVAALGAEGCAESGTSAGASSASLAVADLRVEGMCAV